MNAVIEKACTHESDGVVCVGTELLEAYFDVSRKTLAQWAQQGCPKLGHGKWDLIAVLKWRGWISGLDGENEENGLHVRKLKADTVLKERQGELAEIELQRAKGELVSLAEVEEVLTAAVISAKTQLLALPAKIAPRLLGMNTLDMLGAALQAHGEEFVKATNKKAVARVIEKALGEFRQAKSLVEVSDMVTRTVHDALETLADTKIQ